MERLGFEARSKRMKLRLFSILICILTLASCTAKVYQRETPDPCKDPTFVKLRTVPVDSLTQREYEYVSRKEQECEAYQNAKMNEEATDQVASAVESLPVIELLLGIGIGIIAVLIHL